MRKVLIIISLFLATPVWALEQERISLSLPGDFFAEACLTPIWKERPVVWKGVKDARNDPEVGRQSRKKGKEIVSLLASPPLEEVFESSLKNFFNRCGLQFVSKTSSGPNSSISVTIKEFHADFEKRLIKGKGKGTSRIEILIETFDPATMSYKDQKVLIAYDLELEGLRRKKLRQVEEAINTLLQKTLEQLPRSAELRGVSF